MKRIFKIAEPFLVPDGTLVSPFLNAKDSKSGLPFDLLAGFSLAAGVVEPKVRSKIHVMPYVTQVTYVCRGRLTVRMKGPQDREPYTIAVQSKEAVLTEPGSFFQLENEHEAACEVLYIVSPAYLFEMCAGEVKYDDSVVLDEDWDELVLASWRSLRQFPTQNQRREAEHRLAKTQLTRLNP